jgi:hypothetical protein
MNVDCKQIITSYLNQISYTKDINDYGYNIRYILTFTNCISLKLAIDSEALLNNKNDLVNMLNKLKSKDSVVHIDCFTPLTLSKPQYYFGLIHICEYIYIFTKNRYILTSTKLTFTGQAYNIMLNWVIEIIENKIKGLRQMDL